MNRDVFSVLDAQFKKFPMLAAGPAASDLVEGMEQFAGFGLPESYKAFVSRYGGAIVGPYSIFGVGASAAMGNDEGSAVEITSRFREQKWPGTDDSLVISRDHAGNAIMLSADGAIRRFDHDTGNSEMLASCFDEFLLRWCLKLH